MHMTKCSRPRLKAELSHMHAESCVSTDHHQLSLASSQQRPIKKRPPNITIDSSFQLYHWREMPQVSFLSQQKFCREDKTRLLPQQKYACRDKTFVATKDFFCRNKHVFVATSDKTFVATKMILVAAPASDIVMVRCCLDRSTAVSTVLLYRQKRTIATGPCTIALEIKSSIKSMRMKETSSHFCFEATSTLRSH